MKVFANLLITTIAVMASAYVLGGVSVASIWWAFGFALILAIVNVSIRPLLQILSLPITIVTFGLFAIIVNGLSIMIASWLTGGGVVVDNLWYAIIFGIFISLISSLLNWVLGTNQDELA